ncbi:MAG: Mannonate dehydratase [Candidatus Moanabacter tarae]|uniref:mannonate dehydratase n=1 Tax=Candidatus Moanibacter tarae TaxID=2200854 RepID=A0A2Z4AE08_9BACT|nr:MAG: Mannonate dehydratase [Candidatus Moanabacter tarae]|tara:strand:- start:4395 stop:5345 length:951 start_codon:yes stop_codon:yes gene_type:complete
MTIQEQLSWEQINDDTLSFFRAIGVDYLAVNPAPDMRDGVDRVDYWRHIKALTEKHGLKLTNVAATGWDEISLGLPDRDEKISAWCTMLRNLGEVGIPTLGWNFKPMGNFRTTSSPPGRGGASYSTFDYEEFMRSPPYNPDKEISCEKMWENLKYFLERVIPCAEKNGVRMALHPDDPPIPEPLGGAARIVSTLDHYHKIFDLVPSHCNAMLFCQGCVREMGHHVPTAIRDIGSLNKIAYVHFRNIRGTPKKFQEVFLDEGDVDMFEAMMTYKEVGFKGPFMMDHTPEFPNPDSTFWGGRAFAVGYMRSLIQAVYR